MKSIMEEASSVSKAIEKAWARAQKPTSFSVKVLEEAVKNFFGLTSKPAKIAFYFEESSASASTPKPGKPQSSHQARTRNDRPERAQDRVAAGQTQRPAGQDRFAKGGQQQAQSNRTQRPAQERPVKKEMSQRPNVEQTKPEMGTESSVTWPVHIKTEAEQWLNKAITALRSDARIEYAVNKNELQVTVNCALALNGNERLLCSSLALLLMQAMRNQFKNETRGLRVHIKTVAIS